MKQFNHWILHPHFWKVTALLGVPVGRVHSLSKESVIVKNFFSNNLARASYSLSWLDVSWKWIISATGISAATVLPIKIYTLHLAPSLPPGYIHLCTRSPL